MKVWYWSLGDSRDYDHCDLSTDERCGGSVSLTRKGAKDHFCIEMVSRGWPVWDVAMLLVMGCLGEYDPNSGRREWYNLWFDTYEVL